MATTAVVVPFRPDIEKIQRLADEAGTEVLTDEELTVLNEVRGITGGEPQKVAGWNEDLSGKMDRGMRRKLANDIINWYNEDLSSRKDWLNREAEGMRVMGVTNPADTGLPFEGASEAHHPLLAEAATQFWANSVAELWPGGGPVKATVVGVSNAIRQAQARRVHSYMNYHYTERMPSGYRDFSKMLFRVPLSGSVFRKTFFDDNRQIANARNLEAADFVVPYNADSLEEAPRHTEVIRLLQATFSRLQRLGFYREFDKKEGEGLIEPNESPYRENDDLRNEIDSSEGRRPTGQSDQEISRRTLYEMHAWMDLKTDYEFSDPRMSSDEHIWEGLPLPWIVTVDLDEQEVVGLRRNWWEDDPLRQKIEYYQHYGFIPGFGFYYFGLYHLIGSLANSATGALRALMDAAQFSNLQAGYAAADVKIEGGDKPLRPGEWRKTQATAEDLQKAFYRVPYGEPSPTLLSLLQMIDQLGRQFASTTEVARGASDARGPVGTTLAVIEQSQRVPSSIHKGLHDTAKREFQMMAKLIFKHMQEEEYPYEVANAERAILRKDFDGRVDVLPVSDPAVVSSAQRIAMAQTVMELSERAPAMYDQRAVHRRMLEALRVPHIEEVLPNMEELPRLDPVEEDMLMLTGKPVKAFPDQDQTAHMQVHENWFASLPPPQQEQVQGAHFAHMADHMAWQHRLEFEMIFRSQLGQTQGAPRAFMEEDGMNAEQSLDPEMERQLSYLQAQAVQLMPPPPTQQDLASQDTQARIQRQDAETEARIQRENAESSARMGRSRRESVTDVLRKNQVADAEMSLSLLAQANKDALAEQTLLNKFEQDQARSHLERVRSGG